MSILSFAFPTRTSSTAYSLGSILTFTIYFKTIKYHKKVILFLLAGKCTVSKKLAMLCLSLSDLRMVHGSSILATTVSVINTDVDQYHCGIANSPQKAAHGHLIYFLVKFGTTWQVTTYLRVNSTHQREIIQETGGCFWKGRAVDGKLKSNVEWPYS